ncbi:MAG: FHA domain-containing protein [Archangium sp.]
MAFTLRVTSGAGESEEFSFESGEARLGRTADNDVVIKDPSSSRSHARVYEEAGRFFVEDLKSANGTRLNTRALKAPAELKTGDRIVIGDITLHFTGVSDTDTVAASSTLDESAVDETVDPNQTILKPPSKPAAAIVRKPPPRAPTPPPSESIDEEASDNSTKNFEVPPPRALSRRPEGATPIRPQRALDEEEVPMAISAAERARQRRALNKSSAGKLQLMFSDLPLAGRIVVGTLATALVLGSVGGIVYALIPKKVERRAETVELKPNSEAVRESYGAGESVDFERPDMKSFIFSYQSPTSIVGVLHYQAADCSKDEVTIELNGQQLATIPPDTMEVATRQLEVVLPSSQLRIGDANELVFDNVNNPPGDDPWRVWNVWVEVIPIPQMSAEETTRRAKEDLERASRQYDLRDVGSMNLFRSWKQYRDAWLLLEATPDRPADLLELARTRMREIRPELDRKCSGMLVDYQKEVNQRNPNISAARKVLQNIPSHFEKEHPCFGMSRALLRDLDDVSEME